MFDHYNTLKILLHTFSFSCRSLSAANLFFLSSISNNLFSFFFFAINLKRGEVVAHSEPNYTVYTTPTTQDSESFNFSSLSTKDSHLYGLSVIVPLFDDRCWCLHGLGFCLSSDWLRLGLGFVSYNVR